MDYKMEELLPIVSELAQKYTGYESTSITYEQAQMLMEAVLYCLNEYNHSCADGLVHRNISVKEQYHAGAKLIFEKVEAIRKIFNALSLQFEDFGVKCLHDTVLKGIPHFLKWYDIKFCPQNTILSLDYPLLTDCSSLKGADAVYQYIRGIQTEQLFLGAFDKNYVILVLGKYNFEYQEMMENICHIVLANIIGHIAVKKPINDTLFLHEEYQQLSKIFGGKSISDIENIIKNIVIDFVKNMTGKFHESSTDIMEYLCCDARNIAVQIHTAIQYERLDKVFLL